MNRKITIRPEAAREVEEAFDWYELQSEGLGMEFLRAADACLSAIRRNPFAYPMVYEQTRRALLKRFPYMLIYVVADDSIVVLACFHAKRDPVDWLRRVEP